MFIYRLFRSFFRLGEVEKCRKALKQERKEAVMLGRAKAAETFVHGFIEQAVVHRRGMPAQTADDADILHAPSSNSPSLTAGIVAWPAEQVKHAEAPSEPGTYCRQAQKR